MSRFPGKGARFCRVCGEALAEVVVLIRPEHDPQTGLLGPDRQRRWDCPKGTAAAAYGYEGGHSSPDFELLPDPLT